MSPRIFRRSALHAMEQALEASEPRMSAMFAVFTRLTAGEEPLGEESLSPRSGARGHPRVLLLLPLAAVMVLVAGLVLGLTAGGASACGVGTRTSASVMRSAVICQAPAPPRHARG